MIFYGHGREDRLIGQDGDNLLDEQNLSYLSNKWCYWVACLAGKKLGPEAIKQGVKTVFCWDEIFVFSIDEDEEIFKEIANFVILSMLDGLSMGESFKKLKEYARKIEKKLRRRGKHTKADMVRWNVDHISLLGDEEVNIS